jgi:hypothetical protein
MKRIFTFLFGVMMLASLGMKAQFTADVHDVQRFNWTEGIDVDFKLSEVAAQLQCSPAQLVDALDERAAKATNSNDYQTDGFFQLETATSSYSFHSEQYGGFEMTKDGDFCSWDNALSIWGVYIHEWDIIEDRISFTVCQVPSNAFPKGVTAHGIVSINLYGGKATFEFTFTVDYPEGIDKEPETDVSKLTIVGEIDYPITQELKQASNEWGSEYYWIPINGAADALGMTSEYMQQVFKDLLHVKTFNEETNNWGALTNNGGAVPAPGFYFCGGVRFEGEEEESMECRNGLYRDNNIFWVMGMQYVDDANGQWLYCGVGQTLNAIKPGQTRYGDVYLVYGDKAFIIHISLTIPNMTPITDLTKVGGQTWTVTDRDPRKTWTELEWLELNLDSIAALFTVQMGKAVTPEDFVLTGNNAAGGITTGYTADNSEENHVHGFWMTPEGIVQSYNDAAFYVNYYDADARMGLGNKPNVFDGGETCTGSVYLVVDGTHYYEVKVDMSIMKPQYTFEECEIIDYDLTVKLVPSASAWEIGKTFMQDAEMLLGNSGTLYGVKADGSITTAYSVSEATDYGGGGFWMSPEDENHYAYADYYGTGNGAFAMWYYESYIHWFTVPGLRKPGEYSTGVFYIADLWNGKALKLNVTLRFVEKIVEIKPIAEEDLTLNARNPQGDDFDEVALNLSRCCEELVCTEDELLENGVWKVVDKTGELTDANFDDMYGFAFNEKGEAIENIDDATFTVGFVDGVIRSWVVDDANVNNVYKTVLYVEYNNKLYAFNITIGNEDSAVRNLDAEKTQGRIYDLAGRVVKQPTKGLYIQDGKKILIK